jgi:hypothetical protein
VLPNARFRETFTTSGTIEHLDRALHGTWRAQLNGNLSRVGWYQTEKRTGANFRSTSSWISSR